MLEWFSERATTVVVLVGQYLRGADVSPRGHPGDGAAEVQVYAMGVFEPSIFPSLTKEEVSGPRLLSEIAEQTGGRAFSASSVRHDFMPSVERWERKFENERLEVAAVQLSRKNMFRV